MPKPRKLTAEELSFIEETLDLQDNMIVEGSNDEIIIVQPKEEKQKKLKTPAYRNPLHWAVGLIMAPILLSGAFMFFLLRLEVIFGTGSLAWLSDTNSDGLVEDTATEMGIGWLPEIVEVYQNRWLIIGALFTVFFILAAIVVIYDSVLLPKILEKKDKKRKAKIESENQNG